jgi:hypothetical protein
LCPSVENTLTPQGKCGLGIIASPGSAQTRMSEAQQLAFGPSAASQRARISIQSYLRAASPKRPSSWALTIVSSQRP